MKTLLLIAALALTGCADYRANTCAFNKAACPLTHDQEQARYQAILQTRFDDCKDKYLSTNMDLYNLCMDSATGHYSWRP
jgi:hypothetical protein